MLKHNPEVRTVKEKLTRYDDHSIDSRIQFIQQLLEDKDLEWSKDGEAENVHPANDGDFMSMVEKRAEEQRESTRIRNEITEEMDMLKGEK